MAQVALTNDQKNTLRNSASFRTQVEWAVLNKARYWSQLDGTSVPASNWIRWAKSRRFSTELLTYNDVNVDEYVKLFLIYLTQTVYNNTVAFDNDTVIAYMLTNSTFDALADSIFDAKIAVFNF